MPTDQSTCATCGASRGHHTDACQEQNGGYPERPDGATVRQIVAYFNALAKSDWSDGVGKWAAWAGELVERKFGDER